MVQQHKHKYKLRRHVLGGQAGILKWRCTECKTAFYFPAASIRRLVTGELKLVPQKALFAGNYFAAVPKER